MEITNNTASGVYTNDYKNKSVPGQDYENTMKMKMPETEKKENKTLGWVFYMTKTVRSLTGLFKQSLDGKGLLGIFERYAH